MADSKRSSIPSKGGNPLEDAVQLPQKKVYTTWPEMIRHWPKTTLCIVSNEFCERFSYYGMRTVLTFYLLNVLKFTDNQSTIFFNGFTVLCYTTPLLGSIIADGYIGKFWTIFTVSILYAVGQVILALASVKNFQSNVHPWMDLSGLLIIAFGTGGIKPCVSAFGGDQFELGQERMLSLFFSMFYFSINAGSMISTFISPIFRSQPCLGQDSCYPLAFGVPAVLMILATAVFMAGSFWYKKNPPKENVFGEVARLMGRSVSNKWSAKEKKDHWLDHYLTTHVCEEDPKCMELRAEKRNKSVCQKARFISDVKSLLRVLVMFLPVPMFWALYDQQGSVWLLQGIQMDCRLTDSLLILPDQMQTLNAVLILVFIPLFQVIIYPLASKCIVLTPLRKMVAGGLLASLSFLITGFVQLSVNQTLPTIPAKGEAFVSFWNQIDGASCSFTVTDGSRSIMLSSNATMYEDKNDKSGAYKPFATRGSGSTWTQKYTLKYSGNCPVLPTTINVPVTEKKILYVAVNNRGWYSAITKPDKPTEGTGEFSMSIVSATQELYAFNFAMCRTDASDYDPAHPCNPRSPADFYYWETDYNDHTDDRDFNATITSTNGANGIAPVYKFKSVKPGKWELFYLLDRPKDVDHKTESKSDVKVATTGKKIQIYSQGGVYVFALTGSKASTQSLNLHVLQVVQSNSVNILWQVPQIVVITAAEILFSITGYEFAYSQSAPSMKALVQALWLLTTAFGDTIIVIITILNLFSNMATEFFVYAGAMAVVIIIFALLSIFYYEYNYYTTDENDVAPDDFEELHNTEVMPLDNKAFDPFETDVIDVRF
ncbi:unnamed protein product [Caenorhabditis auriculariae]|uniref:Oligopeptide transporter 1 n=1 Tax=Caenorhabditis auriculariae TaxID=2777116 RepID=A0A8S1GNZ8_9PELO|nr:unnamed protein product [Caenorhabditis auriculariae]